jgi:hypothetical protein
MVSPSIEKLACIPVKLQAAMGAAIHIGVNRPVKSNDESRRDFAVPCHGEIYPEPAAAGTRE